MMYFHGPKAFMFNRPEGDPSGHLENDEWVLKFAVMLESR
jgi:hypothetical protein